MIHRVDANEADARKFFDNAAVAVGAAEAPAEYRIAWSDFDNATGTARPIGNTRGATTAHTAPRGLPSAVGSFVEIDISADSAAHPSWREPVRAYFRRVAAGWKLVGLERLP